MLFFAYLPLRFDAIVYSNNIIGEGTCTSYLADDHTTFSYLYQGNSYFGSDLKTLRLTGLPYNVNTVGIYLYDIESVDIVSYDIAMFGRTVAHLNRDGLTHPYSKSVYEAVISNEEPLVHLALEEGQESISISFPGNGLIPKWIWFAYFTFVLAISIALAAVLVYVLIRAPRAKLPLLSASAVLATLLMGCFICGSLPYVNYTDLLLNWLLLFGAMLLVNALSFPWLGSILIPSLTIAWYIADSFVITFRNKPIMPADLKALGTAREVLTGYDLTLSWRMILGILVVVLYGKMIRVVWRHNRLSEAKPIKTQIPGRVVHVALAATVFFAGTHNSAFSRLNSFQWDARVLEGFHREGIVLTFLKSAISGHVSRPDGYSRETVTNYLNDYEIPTQNDTVHPTRIIMIMNEAFSDLRTVGLDPDIDVMPFIDSLDENVVEGDLYVSVIGGGTCNTEFEALTGNTLAFMGAGAYPYTENVTKQMFSLASYFENNGYTSEAFHANKPQNWNRGTVYPNLGFDKFNSISDFPSISYLHNYVTDSSDYSFIENIDDDLEGTPRFLFDVTIQNHADYDHFYDLEEAAVLVPYDDNLHQNARVYLSMLEVSDESLEALFDSFKDSDEPTMIVFFGDHQPMLPSDAQADIYTNVNSYLDYFKTKFFVWTNYETETVHGVSISANYLPWLILDRGNFALPPYVQMLEEMHAKYPVFTSQGVIDNGGIIYDDYEYLIDDPLVERYRNIQYANIFDEIDDDWFMVK